MALPVGSSGMELQPGKRLRNNTGDWQLQHQESWNRRNSIPPAKTPTAKHILAYLPRPPTETGSYGTFPQKVGASATRSHFSA